MKWCKDYCGGKCRGKDKGKKSSRYPRIAVNAYVDTGTHNEFMQGEMDGAELAA